LENSEHIKETNEITRKNGWDKFAYYSVRLDVGGIMYSGIVNVGIDSKNNKASFYDINPLQEIKK